MVTTTVRQCNSLVVRLFSLLMITLCASCSVNHNLNIASYYAGELGVTNQHSLYRQKPFSIPAQSNLLLANISNHYDTPMGYPIAQNLERQLASNFAQVHLSDKPQSLKSLNKQAKAGKHDFLITVELLDKSDQMSRDMSDKNGLFYDELYPNKTQLKIAIYDARSYKLLDLAYIRSRSGLLVTGESYIDLVRHSLGLYSNSLSGRQLVGVKDPVY